MVNQAINLTYTYEMNYSQELTPRHTVVTLGFAEYPRRESYNTTMTYLFLLTSLWKLFYFCEARKGRPSADSLYLVQVYCCSLCADSMPKKRNVPFKQSKFWQL